MKIIINGANGKMGHILTKMAGSENVAALVDMNPADGMLASLDGFTGSADCVIDFTNHKATPGVLNYCVKRGFPVLIASTGQTDEELAQIHEASAKIPVFLSPNMSIGVALVADLAERVARVFGDCDIEMIEAHHNQKLDVPSGTALMLAKRIQEAREGSTLNIGRHENGKRDANEIGIHSLRYGSEVGTHEVIFSNGLETITIKHDAKDRALFAKGALSAAKWLVKQKPGLYGMRDFLREA
ncbi:MAG: 4-hydroxy-tetrahydrodipicolinate reductase [Synergistaceae bacterium]|nr:4-hydroxy-tetrahydrodipicolinate reductase [Synergistaceae bacterium]